MGCYTIWREKESRSEKGKEIFTLRNTDQIKRNQYYVSSLVDVVEFLVANQFPLRGKVEVFDNTEDGGSGLFVSLLDFNIGKDLQLAEIVKTVPKMLSWATLSQRQL